MNNLGKEQMMETLRSFVTRRDDLLHEDIDTFEPHLKRFVALCKKDPVVQAILQPLQSQLNLDSDGWLKRIFSDGREERGLYLPDNKYEELLLRYAVISDVATRPDLAGRFGLSFGKMNWSEGKELFRNLIIRPFVDDLSYRLSQKIELATPEERTLQAVPLKYIPQETEVRIFLSHKSVDKPLVKRYYAALKELGFSPWLDEADLPAGSNLERTLLRGFEESCAAVFFITENFKDENYLSK